MRRAFSVVVAAGIGLGLACVGQAQPGAPRAPLGAPADLRAEYKQWLDRGRTPSRVVDFVREHSPGFRAVDPREDAAPVRAGDRLLFVNDDRTALLVVVGSEPVADAGVRLVGAHIDTPSPRLRIGRLTAAGQRCITVDHWNGTRAHHYHSTPLAIVGRVAPVAGGEVEVSLGLDDDFAFHVTTRAACQGGSTGPQTLARGSDLAVMTSAAPSDPRKPAMAPVTLANVLLERYTLRPRDLEAAELYLVPRHRARDVGLDGDLIGAHGQDDRANSYAAWRALVDLPGTPRQTAAAWLVDREEIGSTGRAGARSRFLELALSWIVAQQGTAPTEAVMHRAMAASLSLSADTPAAINPNFDEVHEPKNAPVLGGGPALFPFTGRGGKVGGSAAGAGLVASVIASFDRAGALLQHGELGRVDEGGGGTIAKYLAHRGFAVVDVGVAVVSMHSPFELTSLTDLWAAYRGFGTWLAGKETP